MELYQELKKLREEIGHEKGISKNRRPATWRLL